MYLVRETFSARPGMASKLASLMKSATDSGPYKSVRVLTDVVGPFNTVVLETEVPDIGEFEKRMKDYTDRPDIRDKMKGYTEMYLEGRREIYRVI